MISIIQFLLEEAMKDPSNKEMLVFSGSHCNACKQIELKRPYNWWMDITKRNRSYYDDLIFWYKVIEIFVLSNKTNNMIDKKIKKK